MDIPFEERKQLEINYQPKVVSYTAVRSTRTGEPE